MNRIQKVLEGANIKLASVASDVMGVSGRAMLAALVAGVDDAAEMAKLARGRLRESGSSWNRRSTDAWGASRRRPGEGVPLHRGGEGSSAHSQLACSLLSVSRSAYYQWSKQVPSARKREEGELRERVGRVHAESRGTYGAPRVQQRLRQEGLLTSKKRVARVMAEAGLHGRQKRRFKKTTLPDGTAPEASDLLQRDFAPQQLRLDQAWVGHITYIRTWQGWAYLATVIDLASRRVVGFAVRDNMRTGLIEEAFKMALTARRPAAGLIFHSDRGSQYTSTGFRQLLAKHQVRQSLSRLRQCWDNAVAERFFSTLKTELIYRTPLATVSATKTAVFEYIEVFYNRQRIHSALGYQSPSAYEASRSVQPRPHPPPDQYCPSKRGKPMSPRSRRRRTLFSGQGAEEWLGIVRKLGGQQESKG